MRRHKFNSLRRFERLEDRRMMAGDIDFANGVVTIDGADYNDVAEVRFENDRVYVDLWAEESDGDTDHEDFDTSISNVQQIVFNGFAGNDVVRVYGTADVSTCVYTLRLVFNGGDDNDTLLGNADGLGGVRVDAFGGAGNDVLYGSIDNDRFEGGTGNDTLGGGAGDDRYVFAGGNLGTDTITEAANADRDTLDFSGMIQGLTIDLTRTGTNYAVNSTDLRLSLPNSTAIEIVGGTAYDDTIIGNSRDNYLYGRGGNDTLVGGRGDDDLLGGEGNDRYVFAGSYLGSDAIYEAAAQDTDTLDFYSFGGPVNLNLALTTEQVVHSDHLTLRLASVESGIENVVGSINYENAIRGNSRDNQITGGLKNDKLYGGLGNDKLSGNDGNDRLYGEGGYDELFGGDDDDYLDGGYDSYQDLLWGGLGKDTFVAHLRRTLDPQVVDRPMDYNDAVDQVLTVWH